MRYLKLSFVVLLFGLVYSCQKELHFEDDPQAHGTLMKDATGGCLPSTVNGIYKIDSTLGSENFVDVHIQVTNPGIYNISSDTVNGIYFNASGSFDEIGDQMIRLNGHGSPTIEGNTIVPIRFDGSVCTIEVSVLGQNTPPAVFVLGGSPGNCTGATLSGTQTAGEPITAGVSATINVTVNAIGIYSISSNQVNGVSYTASGYFGTTGAQTVTLNASGTPANPGDFTYIVTTGADNCSFVVTVQGNNPNPPNSSNDYFPLTAYSNWSYKIVGGSDSDTLYHEVGPNGFAFNGFTYYPIYTKVTGMVTDSASYRKDGASVHQLLKSNFQVFPTEITGDMIILDTSLNAGSNWNGVIGNIPLPTGNVTISYQASVTERGVQIDLAGAHYESVIKVQIDYSSDDGTGPTPIYQTEYWFARGYGIIYSAFGPVGSNPTEYEATRTQIF